MEFETADVIRVLLAVALGGAVGFEREFRDKAAGFRTLIFICLGSCLFTMLSVKIAAFGDSRLDATGDATRIASNIVVGVGFLGAGVILRENGRITGLTTAAAVWLVAALGMAVGAAEYEISLLVTAVAIMVLWAFPVFERWLNRRFEERLYEIACAIDPATRASVERRVAEHGLRLLHAQHFKHGGRATWCCRVRGPLARHERLVQDLMLDPTIDTLRY
jgi:putative Mg2+ transporter-C (MgtC) family protein